MCVHSIVCPKCKTIYTDDYEKEFVEFNGCCSTCDHQSMFDGLSQDEVDSYLENLEY